MDIKWAGVFPAITSKFTENDELDFEHIDKNTEIQLNAGIDGIILAGSLGEASTLSENEKTQLLRHTLKTVAGRVPVLLNIAEACTEKAVMAAQQAEKIGAQGLMLLPPMRYKADKTETIDFITSVVKATSLPIMVYNNPIDYKIEITLEMFDELTKYPNIQAVKESTRDVSNVTRMINRFGNRFAIFTGVDTLSMEALVMGADGWVAGLVNAFPKETVAIYRLIKENRIAEALTIYRWFLPILELDIHPKLVQYIKLAEAATATGTEKVRAPRLALNGPEREKVLKIINDGLATRPQLPKGSWGILQ